MKSHTGNPKAARGILFAVALFLGTISGCSVTRKTTIETGEGNEVRRTTYGVDFHPFLIERSEDE